MFLSKSFNLLAYDQLAVVLWAVFAIFLLTAIVLFRNPQRNSVKTIFFTLFSFVTIVTTAYLILSTLTHINASSTRGPVHWHADFRIFRCGEEIELVDPRGLSNRVGTPLVHEHGDRQIHIEGILEKDTDASLKNFIYSVGGIAEKGLMRIPTDEGDIEMKNGDMCGDGAGVLQVFVFNVTDGIAAQKKLVSFPEYVITPESLVPPGDCVIFDFSILKERTEYVCERYAIAEKIHDLTIIRE